MPTTAVQRTLRTCAILSALTLLFTCICTYGCAAHTYTHGPIAPQAPSDPKTVLWASGAYLGLLLFVIASSVFLLTISSMRRHARKAKRAAEQRAAYDEAMRHFDLEEAKAREAQPRPPIDFQSRP